MERNERYGWRVETTMGKLRGFPGWQDELGALDDDTSVIVCEDGSVNDAESGDMICESLGVGFTGLAREEWREYWGFGSLA